MSFGDDEQQVTHCSFGKTCQVGKASKTEAFLAEILGNYFGRTGLSLLRPFFVGKTDDSAHKPERFFGA